MALREEQNQIRMLDNPLKRVSDLAAEISVQLGIDVARCKRYLYAKRMGYASHSEQVDCQNARRQFGKHYTLKHLRLEKARELDFDSLEDYQRFLEDELFFNFETGEKKQQKIFEYSHIKSKDFRRQDRRVPAQEEFFCEDDRTAFYDFLSSVIDEKHLQVLTQRYYDGLTLKQIGQNLGQTAARAGQLIEEALESFSYEPARSKLREFI